MKNRSGLHPCGVAVLVEPYEPEVKKSLLIMPDKVQESTAMVESRAVVVEVGPQAWHSEAAPRAKVGDKVLIMKYAGYMARGPLDDKLYRLINDRDIFCKIEEKADV